MLWIGLDVGTTAVKAAAYSTDGKLIALSDAATPVERIAISGVQQDPMMVWDTVCGVLRDLGSRIDLTTVRSLGIAAQGDGFWSIDEKGTPIGPAILWNDTRASRDVLELSETGAAAIVAHGCHTSIWPGTSGVLWRWLRKNDPDAVQKIHTVFTCADWIGFQLTGQRATDFSNASIPFLDFGTRQYAARQLEALGCNDLADRLPAPKKANELLGNLTPTAAKLTALPEGLPVSVGTLDLAAMIVGMGMEKPGQAMMIIGTTAVVNILTDRVEKADAPIGASVLHCTADAIVRVLAPSTGAAAFDWFARLHPASLSGESAAEVARKINQLIADVPPGSNGVIFLPYLSGERAPFVEPDIRASFNGMSAGTTKADLGRAVMEGTGFSLLHCIREERGLPEGAIQLTGGGSKNEIWCQIIADIVGRPIQVSEASDQGLWGAACLGASAAGAGEAVKLSRRDEIRRIFQPDHRAHSTYEKLFRKYEIYSRASKQAAAELRMIGDDQ